MSNFSPVKQLRTSEVVLTQLKEAILKGKYLKGEKLPSERELCEDFQVSRVVIREAIRALELKGFVHLKQGPTGGAYVQEPTLENLSNAFLDLFLAGKLSAEGLVQVRKYIEPEVARLASLNMNQAFADSLENAYEQEHDSTVTHENWVALNLEMHYQLTWMCGNPFFEAILKPILDLIKEIILVVKPSHKVIHEHQDHRDIIDAVISGNSEKARQTMYNHISRVGSSLVELEKSYREKKGLASI